MVSAGIPLHQALYFLAQQDVGPKTVEFYTTTLSKLENGATFSESLRTGPQNVGSLNIALIEIAQQTGSLENVLRRIVEHEERASRARKRIASQLVYPLFLGLFAVFTVVVLPGYCLNGILPVLQNEGADLPMVSRAFFGFSAITQSPIFWVFTLLTGAWLAYLARQASQNRKTRGRVIGLLEEIPVAAGLIQNWRLALFSDSLALQLSVGLSPLQAIPLAALALNDPRVQGYSLDMVEALQQGESISASLKHWPNLPQLFLSMAEVGEVSGSWPALLRKLSDYHHQELEHSVDELVTLLEPIALCLMGLIFGVMIVATLTPMLKLIEGLS